MVVFVSLLAAAACLWQAACVDGVYMRLNHSPWHRTITGGNCTVMAAVCCLALRQISVRIALTTHASCNADGHLDRDDSSTRQRTAHRILLSSQQLPVRDWRAYSALCGRAFSPLCASLVAVPAWGLAFLAGGPGGERR